MLIDIEKDIENNKNRMIEYFYDSVESDISSWSREKNFYISQDTLISKIYNNSYYFKINFIKKTLEIVLIDPGNHDRYLLAKYGHFKNIKIKRYVKYIINYLDNSHEMNFFQICVAVFEKIFIKETRKEKLEKIIKNT